MLTAGHVNHFGTYQSDSDQQTINFGHHGHDLHPAGNARNMVALSGTIERFGFMAAGS